MITYWAEMIAQPQKCLSFGVCCIEHWYGISPSAAFRPPAMRGEIDCGSTIDGRNQIRIIPMKCWQLLAHSLTFVTWNLCIRNGLQKAAQNNRFEFHFARNDKEDQVNVLTEIFDWIQADHSSVYKANLGFIFVHCSSAYEIIDWHHFGISILRARIRDLFDR